MRSIKKINELETIYSNNPSDENVSEEIKNCKDDLESLYNIKTNGCIIRSRLIILSLVRGIQIISFILRKGIKKRKVIRKLILEKGDILTSGNEIHDEEKGFYQKLYSSCEPDECNLNELLIDIDAPKLDVVAQEGCEGICLLTMNVVVL